MGEILTNFGMTSLAEETERKLINCKTMIDYLYDVLDDVGEWEKNHPDRIRLKNELFPFADIAQDYITEALQGMAEIAEAIKKPLAAGEDIQEDF